MRKTFMFMMTMITGLAVAFTVGPQPAVAVPAPPTSWIKRSHKFTSKDGMYVRNTGYHVLTAGWKSNGQTIDYGKMKRYAEKYHHKWDRTIALDIAWGFAQVKGYGAIKGESKSDMAKIKAVGNDRAHRVLAQQLQQARVSCPGPNSLGYTTLGFQVGLNRCLATALIISYGVKGAAIGVAAAVVAVIPGGAPIAFIIGMAGLGDAAKGGYFGVCQSGSNSGGFYLVFPVAKLAPFIGFNQFTLVNYCRPA